MGLGNPGGCYLADTARGNTGYAPRTTRALKDLTLTHS